MALGDVLLARFKHAVAQSLPPSSGGTAAVTQALDALSLLAAHGDAAPLLESLLAWRTAALGDAMNADHVALLEVSFWDAVVALTCEGESAARLPPAHVSETLEALAFDALFTAALHPAAEDATPFAVAARARATAAARALGRLSQRRFEAITARLLQELEARLRVDSPAARAEAAELADALRYVYFPVSYAAASSFLRAAAPVRWTPVKKKSAWRHALCAGLAGWLSPATVAQGPRAMVWAEALAAVRVETLAWVAKAERKHMAHGYPLAAALLCAEADKVQLRLFLEGPLLRALRDKECAVRCAALESLHTAVRFYAAMHSRAPHAAADALWVATGAVIAAIPASFRRSGGFSRSLDSETAFDALVSIAACAAQVDSALVLEGLLPELLKEAPSSDAAVAALRALSSIVSAAGVVAMQQGQTDTLPLTCGDSGLAAALTRMRRGHAALGELGIGGALPVQLRSALGSVARAASTVLASTTASTKKGEQPLIDSAGCNMLCALLDCVPFVMPDEWRNDGALAAMLPSFLLFPDAAVRTAGAAALRRAIHAGVGGRDRLSARAALLEAAAVYALRCVEVEALSNRSVGSTVDSVSSPASDATAFVLTVVSDWRAAASLDATEAAEHGSCLQCTCILSRIEGAAIALAVSSGSTLTTRRDALQLITDTAALCESAGHTELHLADVLGDFCSASLMRDDTRAAVASAGASIDGRQWAVAFCAALASGAPLMPSALLVARAHSMRRMHETLVLVSQERGDERGAAIDAWLAAACVAVASLTVPESADHAAERALLVKAVTAPLRASSYEMLTAVECALSCATPGATSAFAAEILTLVADATRAQGRHAAELRHAAALLVCGLAANCALKAAPADALLVFAEDSLNTLSQAAASDEVGAVHDGRLLSDVLTRRFALVETAIATPVLVWPTPLRARLFDACASWSTAGASHEAVDAGLAKLASVPSSDSAQLNDSEHLTCTNDELQRAATDACAVLAAAPMAYPAFAPSTVLRWAQHALHAPQSGAAARRALCAVAVSEPASLPLLLDAAYLFEPNAASAHFSALATGVAAQSQSGGHTLMHPPVASLMAVAILYSADARSEVRCDALALLRAFAVMPAVGASAAAVLASLTPEPPGDSSSSVSSVVSLLGSRVALSAPSLCEDTSSELLRRISQILLRTESDVSHLMAWRSLDLLPAWLEGVLLRRTDDAGSETPLLSALFAVSCLSASACDERAECTDTLWTALCARASNGTAVTEFLLQQRNSLLEPVVQPFEGLVRPRVVAEHDICCIERCMRAVAAAQPRVVATCLVGALGSPQADPGAREAADAAMVLLSTLSAAPPQEFRSELTAATPTLIHAALVVLHRCALEDPRLFAAAPASSGSPTVAANSRDRVLQAHAHTLLDNLVSLRRPAKGPATRLFSRLHNTVETDAEPVLCPDAVFDALAVFEGGSMLAATARRHVLRNACASEALVLLADSPSHVEAACAASVLQALRRPLCQPSTAVLCECIVACMSPGRASHVPHAAGSFAAQCLAVLAAAAEATPPQKLLLHPCVFWAAAAALRSPSTSLVPRACAVLLAFLRALASSPDAPPGVAEEVLLLAAPGVAGLPGASAARGASFPGLARVALRASCTASSDLAPMLLARLVVLPRGGAADALYGDAEGRLWLALGGALPWILSEDDHTLGAQSTASVKSEAAGWLAAGARCRRSSTALVAALEAIAADGCSGLVARDTLRAPLAIALTPPAAGLMAAALLEVLRTGADSLILPALALLQAVFDAPCGVRPTPYLAPLTAAAAGRHGTAARAALATALGASTQSGGSATQSASATGALVASLWPEGDAEAAAGLLSDALAGAGAKRRDAPSFLFQ